MNSGLKWKLIAGFVLVFVAGCVTGGFVAASSIHRYFLANSHHTIAAQRMRERLKSELDLTPEQVTKISPIVDRAAIQLEQIRKDTARRVHDTFAEAHRDMAVDLSPQQREKLEQLRQTHRRMMRHFHHRPGHSPDSPPPDE
jgi:Spy/CpxP family protein refolding chaperone